MYLYKTLPVIPSDAANYFSCAYVGEKCYKSFNVWVVFVYIRCIQILNAYELICIFIHYMLIAIDYEYGSSQRFKVFL